MRLRLLAALGLAVGIVLLLTLAIAAQEAEARGTNQTIPDVGTAGRAANLTTPQDAAGLSHTAPITFTPAFTTYLSAVFSDYASCLTTPTLISPTNGSALDTLIPLFTWDSGDNPSATKARLEIWLDPQLTDWAYGLTCTGCGTQGVYQWRPKFKNLDPATTHYWRVYLMCGDTQGPYSEVWSFTTGSGGTILSAPGLLSPANGSTLAGTTVTLQWSSVSGAVEYLVHYEGDGRHAGRTAWGTEATLYALGENTTYEWYVQARNDYAWGTGSTHWEFTTGASGAQLSPDPSSPSLPYLPHHIVVESNDATIVHEEQDIR